MTLPGWLGGGKKKTYVEHTETSCEKCGAVQQRRFRAGDYVFKEITGQGACASCGEDAMVVRRIFSEEDM